MVMQTAASACTALTTAQQTRTSSGQVVKKMIKNNGRRIVFALFCLFLVVVHI